MFTVLETCNYVCNDGRKSALELVGRKKAEIVIDNLHSIEPVMYENEEFARVGISWRR